MEFLFNPWPWFVSGPLIGFTLFLLLMVGKRFGMSSNLRTICAIGGAGKKVNFFNFDWKAQRWNLIVAVGALIGGYIAANYLTISDAVNLNPETVNDLHEMGFKSAGTAYMPTELFDMSVFGNVKNLIVLVGGGLLVGFGARYAGGCTSGHAISGLSNLQLPSLIAVIGFFIGGLLMVHILFPLIF
ncbi:YeeE/YedE family protein [Urechidicola vernalis]|uniref:YeeE/YedE thiosulfate transporter family protein n=1 Tax=Urechidicola vernalis TaxID=3075600 RepID=A0ABU2Y383_9FLAO|nr:YeeE/YedE thiosulfate transporter family protein [Urechidicola sp. P050]MDT0552668.1 YeeE/YedE thiosulfate transporter family protein [Urechidicola sp. P050]